MKDIDRLISFVKFTNKFREVERIIYVKGHPHPENDSEHSYQLALTAWFIIDSKKLSLNISKTIGYALAHDLVEIYAGDTYAYTTNEAERDSKKEREEKAAQRIREEFSEFSELHHVIEEYEKRDDAESKFIYALDKILPIINIYLDEGRSFRENGVTLDMLIENKTAKVAASSDVKKYFDELLEILKTEESRLFPKI